MSIVDPHTKDHFCIGYPKKNVRETNILFKNWGLLATYVDGWSYLSVLRVYIDPIHWGACDGGQQWIGPKEKSSTGNHGFTYEISG